MRHPNQDEFDRLDSDLANDDLIRIMRMREDLVNVLVEISDYAKTNLISKIDQKSLPLDSEALLEQFDEIVGPEWSRLVMIEGTNQYPFYICDLKGKDITPRKPACIQAEETIHAWNKATAKALGII